MNKKILAISSGGGHWVQLMRLRPAFKDNDVVYATVHNMYRKDIDNDRFYCVTDATRWNKLRLVRLFMQILLIVIKEKPDVIISTGAAPGSFAIMIGFLLKRKTIWVDSMANVKRISLGGQKILNYADLFFTQWPDLAEENGPIFEGSVL